MHVAGSGKGVYCINYVSEEQTPWMLLAIALPCFWITYHCV